MIPDKLKRIIELFEMLPDVEKRETLITYADQAANQSPREGEEFDLEDIRKDEECTDTVGVFLRVDPERRAHFRISLGPQVQTLTKAMTSILCKGLDGSTIEEILDVPADLTFESMDDFSPAAVARKVESLNKLLTARNELANLLTYMDGKSGAEELLGKILNDPALMKSLASAPKAEAAADASGETEAPKE